MVDHLKLLRDMAWNMSPQIATSLIGFATVSAQVYFLPSSHYGLWIAIRAVLETSSLIDLGIGWAITRRSALGIAAGESEPGMPANLFGLTIIAVIGTPLVQGFGLSTAFELAKNSDLLHLVWPLTLSATMMYVAAQISNFTHSVLFGLQRFEVRGALSVGQTLSTAVGTLICCFMNFGVGPIAIWHGIVACIFALIGLALVGRLAPYAIVWPSLSAFRRQLPITRFALSSQLTEIALSVIWDVGVLLIGFLAGPAAIVPYYVGTRVPRTLSMILGSAAEVMLPRGVAEAKAEAMRDLIVGATRWNLFKALPVATALFVLSAAFLQIWIRRVDSESLAVLRLTLVAVIIETCGNATLYFLWGRAEMRRVTLLAAGRLMVVGAATLLLVPTYAAHGAAWALLAGMALGTVFILDWLPAKEPHLGVVRMILRGFPPAILGAGIAATLVDSVLRPWPLVDLLAGGLAAGASFLGIFLVQGGPSAEQELARKLLARAILPFQILLFRDG